MTARWLAALTSCELLPRKGQEGFRGELLAKPLKREGVGLCAHALAY